jgi:hypothetical protein
MYCSRVSLQRTKRDRQIVLSIELEPSVTLRHVWGLTILVHEALVELLFFIATKKFSLFQSHKLYSLQNFTTTTSVWGLKLLGAAGAAERQITYLQTCRKICCIAFHKMSKSVQPSILPLWNGRDTTTGRLLLLMKATHHMTSVTGPDIRGVAREGQPEGSSSGLPDRDINPHK